VAVTPAITVEEAGVTMVEMEETGTTVEVEEMETTVEEAGVSMVVGMVGTTGAETEVEMGM
jgi:hypothetical protein